MYLHYPILMCVFLNKSDKTQTENDLFAIYLKCISSTTTCLYIREHTFCSDRYTFKEWLYVCMYRISQSILLIAS